MLQYFKVFFFARFAYNSRGQKTNEKSIMKRIVLEISHFSLSLCSSLVFHVFYKCFGHILCRFKNADCLIILFTEIVKYHQEVTTTKHITYTRVHGTWNGHSQKWWKVFDPNNITNKSKYYERKMKKKMWKNVRVTHLLINRCGRMENIIMDETTLIFKCTLPLGKHMFNRFVAEHHRKTNEPFFSQQKQQYISMI